MNEKILNSILRTVIILGVFTLGYLANTLYSSWTSANNYQREYNGLYMNNNYTHPEALKNANTYDSGGEWVCVNVRDMSYRQALETCNHEVGHEIFANYCGSHVDECINVTEDK